MSISLALLSSLFCSALASLSVLCCSPWMLMCPMCMFLYCCTLFVGGSLFLGWPRIARGCCCCLWQGLIGLMLARAAVSLSLYAKPRQPRWTVNLFFLIIILGLEPALARVFLFLFCSLAGFVLHLRACFCSCFARWLALFRIWSCCPSFTAVHCQVFV